MVQQACGFKSIVAHYYWLHLLLHSEQIIQPSMAEYVYDLATSITDLNPHENIVYRFAATWLMVQMGHPVYAVELLRKSLQSSFNSDDWRIYFLFAYHANFIMNDPKKAADYLVSAYEYSNNVQQQLKVDRPAIPHFLFAWEKRLRLPKQQELSSDSIKSIQTLQDHFL